MKRHYFSSCFFFTTVFDFKSVETIQNMAATNLNTFSNEASDSPSVK